MIKMKFVALLCLLSFSFPAFSTGDKAASDPLQQTLERAFKGSKCIGVSAAVISADGKMWQGVCGISAQNVPVRQDMLFDIGSASKNLLATLTLKLVEAELIALDDPIGKYLPTYANINPKITIRQLLNQTDGVDEFVPDADSPWRVGYSKIEYTKIWTPEETFARFVGKPLFEPGQGWAYSQTNYILLRMIVEKVTGAKIHQELDKRLLKPLGLQHTTANLLNPPPHLTLAHGWLDERNEGSPKDIGANSLNWVATLVPMLTYASAGDMAIWIHALLHEKRILRPDLLAEMTTFVATTPQEPLMTGYGFGLVRFNMGLLNPRMQDVAVWGHSGTQFGFTSVIIYIPSIQTSLALMVNRGCDADTNEAVGTVLNPLLDLLLDKQAGKTKK